MAGYTRQSTSSIINGANITAPPLNAEFNQKTQWLRCQRPMNCIRIIRTQILKTKKSVHSKKDIRQRE